MTQERRELKREIVQVWAIAWPVILINLLKASVGIIDFKMVGTLGIASIAAVGMARQVMMFLLVVMIAISGGASVLVAHAHGARDQARVSRVAARAILLMLAATLLLITPAGLLLSGPLLAILGASPEVGHLGRGYLHILFLGCTFTMFNFTVSGILLGVGRTKVSLVLLIGENILNVAFNYMLIFGIGPVPAFGVAGAAMGTVAARALGSIASLWIVLTPRLPVQVTFRDALTIDLQLYRKIIHLGGPRSLQGIVRNFSRLMTIRIITLLPDSTRAVSAFSVGMQVHMVSTFVGLAFMAASMARVGQNMGAGKPDQAERSGWIGAAIAGGLMTIAAAVLILFPEHIMSFFTDDVAVIAMGRTFFMVIALAEPAMALSFSLGGALRGGGDPMSPFIYAGMSDLVVVIVSGYLFAVIFGLGLPGIAGAMVLGAFTQSLPTMLKFRQGKWKRNRL